MPLKNPGKAGGNPTIVPRITPILDQKGRDAMITLILDASVFSLKLGLMYFAGLCHSFIRKYNKNSIEIHGPSITSHCILHTV